MHPIERLRYVARAQHIPARHLVRETAMALADFVGDDASLLIACRRILDRQPCSAPLVWLVAHALGAPDAGAALWHAADEIEGDRTAAAIAWELPDDSTVALLGSSEWHDDLLRSRGDLAVLAIDVDGTIDYELDQHDDGDRSITIVDPIGAGQALAEASHVLIGLDALGPDRAIGRQGALGVAAVARFHQVEVWGVAPTGTALGARMYDGLTRRWHEAERAPLWERPVEELPTRLFDKVATTRGVATADEALRHGGCPIVPELF